jgi:predicted RNA-binding Zn-ribbon protein involved in translation (DUF1610 family)
MKILLLDIETSPNTAYVWGIFKENIPLARIIETSRTLCWAAKWYGEKETIWSRDLSYIHDLIDEADVVVHYNGAAYDIPKLNRDFIKAGLNPPAPYKQVDLLQVVRKQFKFVSNKLAHVAKELGIDMKGETNFQLWVDCMNDDPDAWRDMEIYNRQDVKVLEQLYDKLKPWIRTHPNHGLYNNGQEVCPNCGGTHFHRRGHAYTIALKYQRYQCQDCGNWFRGKKAVDIDKKAIYGNIA